MKKLLSLLPAALLTLFAACSDDAGLTPVGGETVRVSFTADLSGQTDTRAIGDGTTADQLIFQAKDQDGTVTTKVETITGKKATVEVDLIKGQTYQVAFWAQKANTYVDASDPSTVDLAAITVDYSDADAQTDGRDAFFASKTDVSITTRTTETVELKRPFAQVNFGAIDFESVKAAGVEITKTVLTATKLYNKFNVFSGEASGDASATFTAAALPEGNITVNSTSYKYMSVAYILADAATTSLVNAELKAYRASASDPSATVTVNNLPVRRNYQTNVVGKLLSASAVYEVIINPETNGSDVVLIWDGTSKAPATAAADPILITNAAELAWVSEQVAAGNTFSGKTLQLTENINLGNLPWTPIGDATNRFQGTFDGSGKTISNLYVAKSASENSLAGLFGTLNGTAKNFTIQGATISNGASKASAVVAGQIFNYGTVTNVSVKNATVTGHHYLAAIAGYAYGPNITGCSVDGLEITCTNPVGQVDGDGDKAGGIVGYIGEGSRTIQNNTVNNFAIRAYRDMGGIAGGGYFSETVSDNTVTNGTITIDQVTNNYGAKTPNAGETIGRVVGGTPGSNNTYDNVVIYTLLADGTVVSSDGSAMVPAGASISDVYNTMVASGYTKVSLKLAAGTYTPASNFVVEGGKSLTIEGTGNPEEVVIDSRLAVYNADASLTVKGVTLTNTNVPTTKVNGAADGGDPYYRSANVMVYVGVNAGPASNPVTIEDCIFNISSTAEAGILTWTNSNTNVVVKNCTFNCNPNGKPIQMCNGNMTITGCTFNQPKKYCVQVNHMTASDHCNFVFTDNVFNARTDKVSYGVALDSRQEAYYNLNVTVSNNTMTGGDTGTLLYAHSDNDAVWSTVTTSNDKSEWGIYKP